MTIVDYIPLALLFFAGAYVGCNFGFIVGVIAASFVAAERNGAK